MRLCDDDRQAGGGSLECCDKSTKNGSRVYKLNGLLPLKLRDHCVSGNWDPMLVFQTKGCIEGWGMDEWLDSLICIWIGEADRAGSDRLHEGRSGRGRHQRISQTEEKLIELVLIEKSPDPLPSLLLCVVHVKGLVKIGVGWGEFRCQRECETNASVNECVSAFLSSKHNDGWHCTAGLSVLSPVKSNSIFSERALVSYLKNE